MTYPIVPQWTTVIGSAGRNIQSDEQMVNSNNVRASQVYLRDEVGTYYQMDEDQYMRLQLEEMQQSGLNNSTNWNDNINTDIML